MAALAERFDGSVGFVTASSLQSQEFRILVDEDEELVYGFDELDELTHAYAVSIHHSTGQRVPLWSCRWRPAPG